VDHVVVWRTQKQLQLAFLEFLHCQLNPSNRSPSFFGHAPSETPHVERIDAGWRQFLPLL
jgi:hypothetical protein